MRASQTNVMLILAAHWTEMDACRHLWPNDEQFPTIRGLVGILTSRA